MDTITGQTILLVEDEENDVMFMRMALEKAGIANCLQTAEDGEQAIAYLSGKDAYADRARHHLTHRARSATGAAHRVQLVERNQHLELSLVCDVLERWTEIELAPSPVVDLPPFFAQRTRPLDAFARSAARSELPVAALATHGISAAHRNEANVAFFHLRSGFYDQTEIATELAQRTSDRTALIVDEVDEIGNVVTRHAPKCTEPVGLGHQ